MNKTIGYQSGWFPFDENSVIVVAEIETEKGMSVIAVLNQMNFTRAYTLGRLSRSGEAEWDTQPRGYNNTIRWNAGHIFVTMEYFASLVIEEYETVNPKWIPYFVTGTMPSSWEGDAPSREDILEALGKQAARIIKAFEGKLEEPIAEPIKIGPHTIATVEAVAQFIVWHEGVHAGIIEGLNRTTTQ